MGKVVQYIGIDKVIDAAEDIAISSWALFSEKMLVKTYEGEDYADNLRALLERLDGDKSTGLYTICFYDDLPEYSKLKPGVGCRAAFNFRLRDFEPKQTGLHSAGGSLDFDKSLQLYRELDKQKRDNEMLSARLSELENEGVEDNSIIGKVERIMEIPVVAQLISGFLEMFMQKKATMLGQIDTSAFSGAVSDVQENINQIKSAGWQDFDLVIKKLADLSRTDPAKFSQYQSLIKNFL